MVVCAGELLLRLKSPGKSRLLQVPSLEASFGGSETNTAALLVRLGHGAALVTALPDNALGRAALGELGRLGVNTDLIRLEPGRMGLYFLEEGALGRPSKVLYDREGSVFCRIDPDWLPRLPSMSWFHLSGITPALSERTRDWSLRLLQEAASQNQEISLDLNHRATLWNWGQPSSRVLPDFLSLTTVVLANETDLHAALGAPFEPIDARNPREPLLRNAEHLFQAYPTVRVLAVSLRHSESADHNLWSGALVTRDGQLALSTQHSLHPIVDRVGAGDAFGAGIIAGLLEKRPVQDVVEFAAALGALKHSIPGDLCLVSREEAEASLRDRSGRISR